MKKEKKTNQKNIPGRPEKEKKTNGVINKSRTIDLIIVALYVFTEVVPRFDAVDIMGSQWLYLSVLNFLVTIYLVKNNRFIPNRFFKSALFIAYTAFLGIAGLSFFAAYNVVESMVAYSRFLVFIIAFLNMLSIIYHDSKILKPLFLLTGLLLLYQSMEVLFAFFGNYRHANSVDALINSIKGNAGNKNILAASMVIKIPFLLYTIHQSGLLSRIFFSAALLASLIALFIVNARSSYVGLFLELLIYFFLLTYSWFKSDRKLSAWKIPAVIAGVVVLSMVCIQVLFTSLEKQKKVVNYGGIAKRVESISLSNEGSSERLMLWKNAIDFIKKEPWLGGGYGNWKIHSCGYERFWQPGWGASMNHVHNDFLEMCTDIGIPGGIVYAGIFMILLWYIFVVMKSAGFSTEKKKILAVAAMALAAYLVDAVLNFPLERPNMQVLYALSAAIISISYLDLKRSASVQENFSGHKKGVWATLVLTIGILYIMYQVFLSMRIQYMISSEWIGMPKEARVPFKSEEINPYLPDIPNINGAGMPVACIKAKYLCQEKRYDEALAILNADKGSNPYIYFSEFLRSMIALSTNQRDSAYYYAKYAFYHRPASLQLYNYLTSLAMDIKDSMEMEKAFNEVTRCYPKPDLWLKYSDNLYQITNNGEKRMQVILDGLKKYPGEGILLYQKNFLEGLRYYRMKEYELSIERLKEALKRKPGDPICGQNIGFAYINLKQYREAIPFLSDLISTSAFKDGKVNYFRGVCYQNLGLQDSACFDFKDAKSMGYNLNPQLLENCR